MSTTPEDHEATFLQRLTSPFQEKATFQSLATIVGKYANELEKVFADILLAKAIDSAVGSQLDTLGKIVGQPRGLAPDDPTYRLYLKGRVLTNHSSGTVNELSAIAKLVTGASTCWVQENLPNQLRVHVVTVAVSLDARAALITMMRDGKTDAIALNVHTNTYPPAQAFAFAGGTGAGFGVGHLSSEIKV